MREVLLLRYHVRGVVLLVLLLLFVLLVFPPTTKQEIHVLPVLLKVIVQEVQQVLYLVQTDVLLVRVLQVIVRHAKGDGTKVGQVV